jgi:hypothetical protein
LQGHFRIDPPFYFGTMNRNLRRRVEPNFYAIATNGEDRQFNVIADHDALVVFSTQNKHFHVSKVWFLTGIEPLDAATVRFLVLCGSNFQPVVDYDVAFQATQQNGLRDLLEIASRHPPA